MSTDASALMTRDVCTVTPDATIALIAGLLVKHDISAVPVCDPAGALLGLVSESDLIRPFAETNDLRRTWWLSLLAEGGELAPSFLSSIRRDQLHARDVMTTKGHHGDGAVHPARTRGADDAAPDQAGIDRQG